MNTNTHTTQPDAAIEQMLRDTETLVARRHPSLRCLVIARDDSLLCARGYAPRHRSGAERDPATPAPVYSVTKSVSALLVGVCIDRGLIKSVDQPLSELLGDEYRADLESNPYVAQLSLHRLLSMTAGLLWRNARAGLEPMVGRMTQRDDWVRFALSLPVAHDKAGQFQYNSAVSHLLSAVVQRASGESAASFARRQLFEPLGIDEFEWQTDPRGTSIGGWGLSLSPLSMARLGQLCVGAGAYNGARLLSADWIARQWQRHSDAHSIHADNQPSHYHTAGYGYQWWIRGSDDIALYCAEGLGGQLICCMPAARAVIVASCEYPGRRTLLWPLLDRHWIPAVLDGQ